MSNVVALNGTSWAAIVFALSTFLVVAVCTVFIFACCKACRKERQRQLADHVISEAENQPQLDKPPSYWRFFRTNSSLKLSQPLEGAEVNGYANQSFPGTPPPKYDDLSFIFDLIPKAKTNKDSLPSPINEDDSALDQGIFFTARTHLPTLPEIHSDSMLDTISANSSGSGPENGRPSSPPKAVKKDAVVTQQTGGSSSICLERSFRNLVSSNVSPERIRSQVLLSLGDSENYVTRL